MTTVATTDVAVWVGRRRDFDRLMSGCPELRKSIKSFLAAEQIGTCLHEKQRFDPEKAAAGTRSAIQSMELGRGESPRLQK